ncbi:probable transcription factor At3g04930 [Arachis stenosperma]|uniref:probable transcription factor At3g04930 n=1 Tax=Arachis stenosperma TaxID=217475 RepID=UPI0025AC042B|nr:probable transcription factor At3g04930 [Arachis stenosperma]
MMASEQHDTVFPEEDMDEDDEESQEDEEEEDIDDDDVLPDDEENEPSPSTSSAALAVTVAVPSSVIPNGEKAPISTPTANAATTVVVALEGSSSDPKRLQQIEEKKPLDDSRRLFQRLWTDEDEIELLQGFLEYTSQRGSSHHNDTALFYDQIKSKLQLDFNKNQLVEKIRRLKKKYRNVLNKIGSGKEFNFKSAHDQATFEISRKIWSNLGPVADNALDDDEINLNPIPNPNPNLNFTFALPAPRTETLFGNSSEKKTPPSRKRSRPRSSAATTVKMEERRESMDGSASHKEHNFNLNAAATGLPATPNNNCESNKCSGGYGIPGLVEETVRSCLSPLVKELVGGAAMGGGHFGGRGFGGGGFSLNPIPLGFGVMNNLGLGLGGGELVDERWRKQQILELEVYSKRLELVQEQIKAALEELRSTAGS